jgi:hypothetical protein
MSFSQANINSFNTILGTHDYTPVLDSTDPNIAYDKFMKLYLSSYNTAFPLKQLKIPKKYLKRLPWMTNGLVQSSVTKSKLLMLKLKRPSIQNINKYKQFYSLYNELPRKSKVMYYHDEFQRAKRNIKQTWILLKSAINSKKAHMDLPEYFKHNNTTIRDKTQIADQFNSFLCGGSVKLLIIGETLMYIPNPDSYLIIQLIKKDY